MKKILVLALVLLVTGCASHTCENYECRGKDDCNRALSMRERHRELQNRETKYVNYRQRDVRYVAAPVPAVAYAEPCTAPVQPVSNGCQGETRVQREPVEIVYRNTIYQTVYEPRTFSTVEYERMPYSERHTQ